MNRFSLCFCFKNIVGKEIIQSKHSVQEETGITREEAVNTNGKRATLRQEKPRMKRGEVKTG